jgi:hypothetical protein
MILRFMTIISFDVEWLHCHSKERCFWILTVAVLHKQFFVT